MSCPVGQTNIAGSCLSSDVNSLPSYRIEDVFGGASPSGEGACLDVAACFAGAPIALPDKDCTVSLPLARVGLNVGVVPAKGTDGVCSDGRCLVALAEGNEGFRSLDNGRVQLPAAACVRDRVAGVVVVGVCETRTVSIPPCGVATVVSGRPIRPAGADDAGVDAPADALGSDADAGDAGVVIPYGDGGVSVGAPTELVTTQGSAILALWPSGSSLRFGLDTGELKEFDRKALSYKTLRSASGSGWSMWAQDFELAARAQSGGQIDSFDFGSAKTDMSISRAGVTVDAIAFSYEALSTYVAWSESNGSASTLFRCPASKFATCTSPEQLATFSGAARSIAEFFSDAAGIAIGTTDGRLLSCVGKCSVPSVIYSNGSGEQMITGATRATNTLWIVDKGGGRLRKAVRGSGVWSSSEAAQLATLGTVPSTQAFLPANELFFVATNVGAFATEYGAPFPWTFTKVGSLTTTTSATAVFEELLIGTSDGRVFRYGLGGN